MINVEEVTLEEAFEIENQARFIWRSNLQNVSQRVDIVITIGYNIIVNFGGEYYG